MDLGVRNGNKIRISMLDLQNERKDDSTWKRNKELIINKWNRNFIWEKENGENYGICKES